MNQQIERILEFDFVRATENAALNCIHWIGRGEKEKADAAACDAFYGVFDQIDIRGEVIIGEGIKDNAPGIFVGEKLGTWKKESPRFNLAIDPIDGTTNLAKGLPNSICVLAAAQVPSHMEQVMLHLPSFYAAKLSYGPRVSAALEKIGAQALTLDTPVDKILSFIANALGKRVNEVVACVLDRPRNQQYVEAIRSAGAALRMVSDGDITAAVAPALENSGVDLYLGIGGTTEGILAAAALKCVGGDIQIRMWGRDEAEWKELSSQFTRDELGKIYYAENLIEGESAIFCATGISDSPLLSGVQLIRNTATTHSILMRAKSKTVRYITATHNLDHKTIRLRSENRERKI